MDFGKRFLLQEDIEKLSKYKKELDDAMNNVDFEFFDLSVSILDKRTKESEAYFKEIFSHPFDFTVNDKVEIDAKKLDFAKDKNELKDRWNKLLKYETMASLYDLDDEQKQASEKSDTVTIKSFAELEEKAERKSIEKIF